MRDNANMIYGFDAHIFSIGTESQKAKRAKTIVRRKATILKAIDCEFLQLDQLEGYFLWTYDTHPDLDGDDRPEDAIYQTHSTYAYRLSHLDFDKWVEIGKGFADDMKKMGV